MLNGSNKSSQIYLTAGLIAHYPLTNNTDDAYGTGGNESGTSYNGVTYINDVERGSVASFDGVDDYIRASNTTTIKDRTISMFIKKTLTGKQFIFDTDPGLYTSDTHGSWGALIDSTNSTIEFNANLYNNSTYCRIICNYTFELNTYYHLVLTAKDNELKVYINGENIPIATNQVRDIATISLNNLTIGRTRSSSTHSITSQYYFPGIISNVKIYNRVVSGDEVTALYEEENEPTVGLIAHYPLTADAQANDLWVNYDGTNNGAIFNGEYASFDGVNDYIDLGNKYADNNVSVSFWISLKSLTTTGAEFPFIQYGRLLLSVHSLSSGTYYTANKYTFAIYDSTNNYVKVSSTTNIKTDWVHLVFTYNGTDMKLYVDGQIEGSAIATGMSSAISTYNTHLGANYNGSSVSGYSDCNISNLRIYNKPLNQTEVTNLYAEGRTPQLPEPTTDGLLAYYPLDSDTLDSSINSHDGVNNGVTFISDEERGAVADFTNNSITTTKLIGTSGDYTIMCWIKPDTLAGGTTFSTTNPRILFADDTNGFGPWFRCLGTSLNFIINEGYNVQWYQIRTQEGVLSENIWQHVAVTLSSNTNEYHLYINGEEITDLAINDGAPDVLYSPGGQVIGKANNSQRYFDGSMSNMRIYDKVLSQQEIYDIFQYENHNRGD